MRIQSITARQLLDCKARPLVEVEVTTESGQVSRGAAPTGSTVGAHEAFVLRDNDPAEYNGLSVHRAIAAVRDEIAPALVGCELDDLAVLDQTMIELDGTPDKHRLGGNAIYSTSIALLRAAAMAEGLPAYAYVNTLVGLTPIATAPVPSFNMINGGRHGELVQPFNEFIVMPYRADSIQSAVEMSITVFGLLEEVLTEYLGTKPQVAPSYGYAAPSADPRVVLELLTRAVERAGCAHAMAFALDCASSEFYDEETSTYELHGRRVDSHELIDFTRRLAEDFPLIFIEDLLDEDDWAGYPTAVRTIERSLILGDDLIVTNTERLERAVDTRAVDGFILKPNQVGTITEALACFTYARDNGLLAIPSGRSGGVIDDVVMDLSVGLGVPFQKNGAPRSGERIEKINFLLRAAEQIVDGRLADVAAVAKF
jgi:enolase